MASSSYVASALLALVFYSMFSVDSYVHYIEPFWALVIVMYLYFVHGKVWGGISMLITVAATSVFFIFNLNTTIENLNDLDFVRLLTMGLEFSVSLSLIGYIMHQFIYLKNHAEMELRKMNDALRKEKEIVETRDKEKTILLQEIHHRVKNNLQIVMSLLRMQSANIASAETKQHFTDAINRILTMSLIHQKLYESNNLSAIDLAEYLDSLTSDVLRNSQLTISIEKSISVEIPAIGMKTIVPLALMITELISNSAKHAFVTTDAPRIELIVRLKPDSDKLEMLYTDNGNWKPSTKESFGTQLIEALAEQLEGEYTIDTSKNGTAYQFLLTNLD